MFVYFIKSSIFSAVSELINQQILLIYLCILQNLLFSAVSELINLSTGFTYIFVYFTKSSNFFRADFESINSPASFTPSFMELTLSAM